MNKAPTIWMNVTTSANWTRPPVGVVRVETALRDELAAQYGRRLRQCVWQAGQFVEYVPSSTAGRGEALSITKSAQRDMETPLFPLLSRKAALMSIAQGVLSLTPARARPWLNRALTKLKPKVGGAVRTIAERRRTRGRGAAPRAVPAMIAKFAHGVNPSMPFVAGDVLVSIGLDWDTSAPAYFYELRKQGIRVVTCCYDLIPILYPQYCVGNVAALFTGYFLDIAEGSDLTLCISRQSELDLKNLMRTVGGPDLATHVFPLGDNVPANVGGISEAVQAIVREPFILFVSTIERRKNHEVLYRAYHLLCAEWSCPCNSGHADTVRLMTPHYA